MKQTKRQYTQEVKVEAVKLWEDSGRKSKEIGEQLGIRPVLFAKWKRALGQKANPARCPITQATGSPSDAGPLATAEISRLRRENAWLKMEHEILKKQWASSRRYANDLQLNQPPS